MIRSRGRDSREFPLLSVKDLPPGKLVCRGFFFTRADIPEHRSAEIAVVGVNTPYLAVMRTGETCERSSAFAASFHAESVFSLCSSAPPPPNSPDTHNLLTFPRFPMFRVSGRCGHGSPCEQLCYELHDGMYECDCRDGYILHKNGYSCAGE